MNRQGGTSLVPDVLRTDSPAAVEEEEQPRGDRKNKMSYEQMEAMLVQEIAEVRATEAVILQSMKRR